MKVKLYFKHQLEMPNYVELNKDSNDEALGWLSLLFLSFNKYRDWITVEERGEKVYVWINLDEDDYDNWEDISKLIMSKENYDYILEKITKVANQKPKYFIMSYDDNGWIDLETKDELSQDDMRYIDQEKCKRLSRNK